MPCPLVVQYTVEQNHTHTHTWHRPHFKSLLSAAEAFRAFEATWRLFKGKMVK